MVLFIGIIDWLTGYEIAFSIFYVIPVLFSSWYIGSLQSYFISFFASAIWLAADILSYHFYSQPLIPIWNAMVRLLFFCIISYSFGKIKELSDRANELARTDFLTSLPNSRNFYDQLKSEMERFLRFRHLFSIVYIDIDNFKKINDVFGHMKGDEVLKTVANILKENIRSIDVVARIGGDEFVILLPETDIQQTQSSLDRIRRELLKIENFPIAFSCGVATFKTNLPSEIASDLINLTDELMYEAKRNGKNQIKSTTY